MTTPARLSTEPDEYYCDITIAEVLVMLSVLDGTKGILNGNA